MKIISDYYRRFVGEDTRYMLYLYRNPLRYYKVRYGRLVTDRGVFSLRQMGQKNCIFIHITKAAGTSVSKVLFNGELTRHYTVRQYKIILGGKTFSSRFKFTFVRNPWDRIYSAYNYLKRGGWGRHDAAWFEENISHFDDFNEFVQRWVTPDSVKRHVHFMPQVDFLTDEDGKIELDFIGRFESLVSDFEYVCEVLNVRNVSLPKENAQNLKRSYREVYSQSSKDHIANIYARDIEEFGYDY